MTIPALNSMRRKRTIPRSNRSDVFIVAIMTNVLGRYARHAQHSWVSLRLHLHPSLGLKENVIFDKLFPAGTDLARYRNIRIEPTEEAKVAV